MSSLRLQGTVVNVSGDEFKVRTGFGTITVDVDEMPYNPLDHEGYQRVGVGDEVSVTGRIDRDLIEATELKATSVIILRDNGKAKGKDPRPAPDDPSQSGQPVCSGV